MRSSLVQLHGVLDSSAKIISSSDFRAPFPEKRKRLIAGYRKLAYLIRFPCESGAKLFRPPLKCFVDFFRSFHYLLGS